MYTILQICNTGHKITLSPANYCESMPTYYSARKAAKGINFLFGIVRSDRVSEVTRRYTDQNN